MDDKLCSDSSIRTFAEGLRVCFEDALTFPSLTCFLAAILPMNSHVGMPVPATRGGPIPVNEFSGGVPCLITLSVRRAGLIALGRSCLGTSGCPSLEATAAIYMEHPCMHVPVFFEQDVAVFNTPTPRVCTVAFPFCGIRGSIYSRINNHAR